jgi:mRNA interferase MazF
MGGPSGPGRLGPGFRRPVVVVQCDALHRSRIGTAVCVPLTSNLKWALAPGNVRLFKRQTGLPKESIANVSQIVALDKRLLMKRAVSITAQKLDLLLSGINLVSGK